MALFYSLGREKREADVGFVTNNQTTKSMLAFRPIFDRPTVLTVNGTIRTHILSVYAPTESSFESVKDDFYNQLQQTLDSIPQTDVIIVAGDFNAHTGADRRRSESLVGNFGHGSLNDNNFIIGNSHFQHPFKHRLTWRNAAGRDSTMLDYIPINSRFRASLKDERETHCNQVAAAKHEYNTLYRTKRRKR